MSPIQLASAQGLRLQIVSLYEWSVLGVRVTSAYLVAHWSRLHRLSVLRLPISLTVPGDDPQMDANAECHLRNRRYLQLKHLIYVLASSSSAGNVLQKRIAACV